MSNALAIATVTVTLAQAVRTAAQEAVGGADVVIGRPEAPGGGTPRKVHVYLYQVTPNTAQRNADLPSRYAAGRLTQRPQVALDLFYLLAFYGNETDLEPQRMLGAVLRDLHAHSLLSRQAIQDAVDGEPLLKGSNLAEAFDLIRLSPVPLSLEELSKLWSVFFQTPHAVSVAYQASVVLIESDERAKPPPPVLQRGGDDRSFDVLLGHFPALERIHIGMPDDAVLRPRPPSYPAAPLGSALLVSSRHLGDEAVRLRLTHTRLPVTRELPVSTVQGTTNELLVELPDDTAARTDWAAGIYAVTVVTGNADGSGTRTSNALPLALAPRIITIAPAGPIRRDDQGGITLTITVSPLVRPEQQAVLLLGNREIAAEARHDAAAPLTFVVKEAPVAQDWLLRLRVDGVESLLFKRVGMPPRFVFDDALKVMVE